MANNYLQFSANLNVGSKENVATAFDFYAKLSDSLADSDEPLDFCMEDAGDGGLWFHSGDESGAPDQVADFVRNLANGLNLKGRWGLTYAEYCDKPRVNEFNGGAIFLDFDTGETSYINSAHWLNEQIQAGPTRDTSAVYHVDMLDGEAKERICQPGKEWIFETDDDLTVFPTEEAACTWQRAHRRKLGFDPMTGERA